ncbi:hypothetical protein ACFL6S_37675 [Candidatus Poribacteria bacterium]
MNPKLTPLIEHYIEAELELSSELAKLKNYGKNCDCDSVMSISMIDRVRESFTIRKYCLDCGGYGK